MKEKWQKKNNRILWIDITKFLGILIVLLVHTGIQIPYVSTYLGSFMIPVFFVLSGYTYEKKEGSFWSYVKKKAVRLLIPYMVCNVILVAFYQYRMGGFDKISILGIFYSRYMLMQEGTSWNLAWMPCLNSPTWFLTCLFLALCIYELLNRLSKGKRRAAVVLCMGAGILITRTSPILLPWNIENALIFQGLLEFGRFLKEKGILWLSRNSWAYGNILLGFLVFGLLNGSINVSIGNYGRDPLLCMLVGSLGSILCMKTAQILETAAGILGRILGFLGQYTIHIMCWHLLAFEILKKILG